MIIASDFKKHFYIFYGLDYTLSFHSFTPHYSSMGKFCLNEVLHLISTQLSHLIMGWQPSSLPFHYRICTMLCQDHSFNLYLTNESLNYVLEVWPHEALQPTLQLLITSGLISLLGYYPLA